MYFHVKIQLLVTASKSKQDPHWFGSLDPDPDVDPHSGKKLDPDWNLDTH
jgi:hypothetical protein